MSLGQLVTIAEQAPANFYHFILDNEVYATTGGQPVPGAKTRRLRGHRSRLRVSGRAQLRRATGLQPRTAGHPRRARAGVRCPEGSAGGREFADRATSALAETELRQGGRRSQGCVDHGARLTGMESTAPDISLYKEALVVLGAAGVVIPLFHRLRVSSVLGFMLVGHRGRSVRPGLACAPSALAVGDHHHRPRFDRADRAPRRRAAAVHDRPGAVVRASVADAPAGVWAWRAAGGAVRRGAGRRRDRRPATTGPARW